MSKQKLSNSQQTITLSNIIFTFPINKIATVHAIKAYWGSRSIDPLVLKVGITCRFSYYISSIFISFFTSDIFLYVKLSLSTP